MRVEMSLAESLMNAIAAGRVSGVQFKRGKTDELATFRDLQAIIGKNIDSAKDVARINGMNEVRKARREIRDEERAAIVKWLRTPQPGTLCEDQDRDNGIADAIERGDHLKDEKARTG